MTLLGYSPKEPNITFKYLNKDLLTITRILLILSTFTQHKDMIT